MRMAVADGSSLIGKTAKIVFYPKTDSVGSTIQSIPLEAVRIIAENEGEIRYLQDGQILTKPIDIIALRG